MRIAQKRLPIAKQYLPLFKSTTMTKTNELNAKIAKLQKEYELEAKAAEKLGSIKHMTIIHEWKSGDKERIIINPANLDEFKAALLAYPATNEKTVIGTATDKYYKELATPYRMDIDNPAKPCQWQPFEIHIEYWSDKTEIQIEMPIEYVQDFVNISERGITDSEYHYFIGVSHTGLRNMHVTCYNFKGQQMGWYGGNKTLLDELVTNEIIEHLTK
jgi:hypothetical protein